MAVLHRLGLALMMAEPCVTLIGIAIPFVCAFDAHFVWADDR
ncbi:hypothetical protein [Cohaesibacter haloalkalitolerans]|nr:hypothetical protein [Cohaesibacter haloalkalitolerans]